LTEATRESCLPEPQDGTPSWNCETGQTPVVFDISDREM